MNTTIKSNANFDFFTALNSYSSFDNAIDYAIKTQSPAIEGLEGALKGFFIAKLAKKMLENGKNKDIFAVVPTSKDADELALDIHTYDKEIQVYIMPTWGVMPYQSMGKRSIIFGQRAGVLCTMLEHSNTENKLRIFIITQRNFMSMLPSPSYEKSLSFSIKVKQTSEPTKLALKLTQLGYIRVTRVSVKGEFSLIGEVLHIFMPNEEYAHRVTFDFDTIDTIKLFDIELQRIIIGPAIDILQIYPCKEVLWDAPLIAKLKERLDCGVVEGQDISFCEVASFAKEELLEQLEVNKVAEGEELYYGTLWDKQYSIIDYMQENSPIIYCDYDRLLNATEGIQKEYNGMYIKISRQFPVLPPKEMLFDFEGLVTSSKNGVFLKSLHTQIQEESNSFRLNTQGARSFLSNIVYLKEQISSFINNGYTVIVAVAGENQAARIRSLLLECNGDNLFVLSDTISQGFCIPEAKLLVIQENEIFGRKNKAPVSIKKAQSVAIDTFVDLSIGDLVVHVRYGIGKFCGIQRVKTLGIERDYIKLEYQGEEICFVPIEQVNMVQKYIGTDIATVKLDTIGSKSWENRKNRVKTAVEDIAQKLVDLYSKRSAARGFPFPKDSEWQLAFEAAFPYEDTPDQATVSQEIKLDMEKPVPMDRLICGDVGYGKTELAMRAAFKAVMGGKQVAFLAPTTILAEQHYETCIERFRGFPVNIAELSRFVPKIKQKEVLANLALGNVDILVGTHRIIQKDVMFKDLGLMIIDEEQRFGVKDKERLKVLKENIDCLSMSATPIPRTLHMSLLKIRDMSLLTTPPSNRHPIETVVAPYSDMKVSNAIRKEIERGGQVFFLHNRVESLTEVQYKLQQLVPEVIIEVAHGQMSADELDNIFHRFKLGGFHVLISTTIIENGIDIPNVNTIIIDRADMYGISQLYQLRGRVGRSDIKAYAYLLYPEQKSLSEVAMKRLEVISDFTQLGSGFKIAMKDLEIRGAGNLLGKDQSGQVCAVGFDLYLKLLDEAVHKLKDSDYKTSNDVLLELEYSGFIPDTYITNTQLKMEIYKKIANVQETNELEGLIIELSDRFGPIPDELLSLLSICKIRIMCKILGITTLKEKMGIVIAEFSNVANINVDKLMLLLNQSHGRVALNPMSSNELILKTGKISLKEKGDFICEQLKLLT